MSSSITGLSAKPKLSRALLLYVLPGLAIPVIGGLILWLGGRPHAGFSEDMRGIPAKVGLVEMLRTFPASSVRWKNTDLITNVYVVWGAIEPQQVQAWARAQEDKPAFKGLVEASEVVPAELFHTYAPGEKLLFTGAIEEPYKNTEIFIGEKTAVFLMRS